MVAGSLTGVAGPSAAGAAGRDLQWHGPWRSGMHVTGYGLAAFSSHGEYPSAAELTRSASKHRLLLSVWLREGIDIDVNGRRLGVRGRDVVAGYLPDAPWRTDFNGRTHHVGLMLDLELLRALTGERGDEFFETLRRDGDLRIQPGEAMALRAAYELDGILLDPGHTALLREAKSLDLLARLVEADTRCRHSTIKPSERARLDRARELLLADLANPPTIAALAVACGLNTFRLKRAFKERFGLPIHACYQHERMRVAWQLIASGVMDVSSAGHQVGYSNMSHFGKAFRKSHGILPSELQHRLKVRS